MTTFLQPDEAGIEARTKRGQNTRDQNRAACFLHLRDLVYVHPKAASADTIALVQTFEAAVIAEKATREKRLAEARERAERPEGPREALSLTSWPYAAPEVGSSAVFAFSGCRF